MNTPFQLLRNRATRMQELSEEWIQEQASFLRVTPQRFFQDTDRLTNRIILGRLYMFQYDPTLKESLDFYDTFPLVIPLEYTRNGFTGFNLHYLRPQTRAFILETLKDYLTDDRMSERTRINITWDRINRKLQLQELKKTVKSYLTSHIRSRFLNLNQEDWDLAVWIPSDRFKKARRKRVWEVTDGL